MTRKAQRDPHHAGNSMWPGAGSWPWVLRLILSDYATLMIEIVKDNARPEAASVYMGITPTTADCSYPHCRSWHARA
jgi:hypothetical protein